MFTYFYLVESYNIYTAPRVLAIFICFILPFRIIFLTNLSFQFLNLHFHFTLTPIFSQVILYYIFITIYFASTTKISLLDLVKTSDSSFPTKIVSSILIPYFPGKYIPGSFVTIIFSFKMLWELWLNIGNS